MTFLTYEIKGSFFSSFYSGYTFGIKMEYLQHDYKLIWTAFVPFIFYVYPVINEVLVLIKIVGKNEML